MRRAFTLIELLVVIAIIGVLAVTLVPRLFGGVKKAQMVKIQADFTQFKNLVNLAREQSGKTLLDMATAHGVHGCPACTCRVGGRETDLRGTPAGVACTGVTKQVYEVLKQEAGVSDAVYVASLLDPWESPYIIDFVEGKSGCGYDWIRSVGPNGIRLNSGGDDIVCEIPTKSGCAPRGGRPPRCMFTP